MIAANDHNSISVALCTYEGSDYLREQLDSIVSQSITPMKLIICDDCSTDATYDISANFSAKAPFKIRLYRNEQRLGVTNNYLKALSLCQGDYVALCDQDDLWRPDKLELALRCMHEAENAYGRHTAILVHSALAVIDQSGELKAPSFMTLRKIRHHQQDPLKRLLVQNFVTGSTVLLNRALLDAALQD